MTTRLTVIGSEPAWPSASRACSGYILETAQSTVLIDCGTGVFERLRSHIDPEQLTDVIISHLHFDHWVDLIPFRYYLAYEARPDRPPQLHLPPGGIDTLTQVTRPIDGAPDFFAGTFLTREYDPHSEIRLGDVRVTFRPTRHPIDTFALRIETDQKIITYTADTGWDPDLALFADRSDLFLCECAFGAGDSGGEVHLTASEAGKLAGLAHAGRLILVHIAERLAADAVEAAGQECTCPVEHASAGRSFEL